MQVQVDIGFDQLVKLVKQLPEPQWIKLKKEVENTVDKQDSELLTLLLNGPIATKKQLKTIANNRKAINQWRTK